MVTPGGSGNGNGGRTRGRRRRSGAAVPIVGDSFCQALEERLLTVRKTSLFYPGDGFVVYEHHRRRHADEETGELVFRVDSYDPDRLHAVGRRDELVLMGPEGDSILTVRRKWPSLHQRWEGFLGERAEGQKPLFSVRRDSIIGRSAGIGVELYCDQIGGGGTRKMGHLLQYRVEGSFPQRCCAVYEVGSGDAGGVEEEEEEEEEEEGSKAPEAVAEIRRKVVPSAPAADAGGSDCVVLGRDVFCLRLAPGFDAAFAMGLVLVLDRMTGDDGGNGSGDEELPTETMVAASGHSRSLVVGR